MAGSTASGLRAVLISTVVAGIVGYAIQVAAPALLPSQSTYVSFSVFWSTLYLWVAALAGIQQEVSRATHPADGARQHASPLRRFAGFAAVIVATGAVAFGLLLGNVIIPGAAMWLAVALPLGVAGYVLSAALGGVLYGLRLWTAVAFTTILDALLRAILVLPALAAHVSVPLLALLVALPFGIAFTLTWLVFRRQVIGRFALDVGIRGLFVNSSSTVIAATASGLMISGLPMLIGATSAQVSASVTGALILTITLTRAPIVIPVIALQSFLIAAVFKDTKLSRGSLKRIVAIGASAMAILVAGGWIIGPFVVSFISGSRFTIDGWLVGVIVLSAGLTATMCITGPALIALRRHRANLAGWVIAALLTLGALVVPSPQDVRISIALIAPVTVGLAVHTFALGRRVRAQTT
ncbi:hypothetical protein [Microbacterium ureisolvens]|uniref:Polysaccharide biosynthesis protein n=1 Tax=Microbacterium ureisolvens TaxID=2781186 RepID=A0ABS7I444_9MICO|nr:hypothetical protein [Microbacterium ureisolvens]MBW9111859.1 hypothetical protein [Microbacterium ureisolvens]